jgi:hypothetical protein
MFMFVDGGCGGWLMGIMENIDSNAALSDKSRNTVKW